jgi:hypothetical protein
LNLFVRENFGNKEENYTKETKEEKVLRERRRKRRGTHR